MTIREQLEERERQTLDLMLTTLLTPAQIVSGKLLSALSVMVLLVVSSFPPISMVLVFGGITWMDLAALLLCYVAVALVAGSMGIFFSAVFKRSTLASVCTYGVMGLLVAGTYFANRFAMALSSSHLSRYGAAVQISGEIVRPTAGAAFYLLLLNPAATFYTVMNGPANSFRAGLWNTGFWRVSCCSWLSAAAYCSLRCDASVL